MKTYELLQALTLNTEVYFNGFLYTNPLAANRLLSSAELAADVLTLEVKQPGAVYIETQKGGLYAPRKS